MRSHAWPVAGLLILAGTVSACATGAPDVFGRRVTLVPREPRAEKAKGELLAVSDGRIWLREKDGGVREFDADSLREVQVQRHGLGNGTALRIGLIGGLVSTIALTASCSSVEGNDAGSCLVAGAAVGGLFALTGALSSASLDASARAHVAPQDRTLRGYARFPAGLPRDIPPEWLARPPEAVKPRHVE
jgi:hypothetical protein